MGNEQPKFITKEELEQDQEIDKSELLQPAEQEKPMGKVLEGPWKKPEVEPLIETPDKDAEPETAPGNHEAESPSHNIEIQTHKQEQLEEARKELENSYSAQKEETVVKDKEESDKFLRTHESYTEYEKCPVCKGRKRVFLFFPCRFCKGFGSIPKKTVTKSEVLKIN